MHNKGGGVAILCNEAFQCRKMSYGTFNSFEYVALQSRSSCLDYKPISNLTFFQDQ